MTGFTNLEEAPHLSEVHVSPHDNGTDWVVIDSRAAGSSRVDSVEAKQADAEARARRLLAEHEAGGELILHGRDGKVRDSVHVRYGG